MNLINTNLSGVFVVQNNVFRDDRGCLIKTYHRDEFFDFILEYEFFESYYSVSNKNVLRGMHYQKAPKFTRKLISVLQGEILDVVVCVDKSSKEFGKFFSIKLFSNDHKSIIMDERYAHGFLSLEDNTIVNCMMSDVFSEECDSGIKYDSFGFDWGVKDIDLIISEKDKNLIRLDQL